MRVFHAPVFEGNQYQNRLFESLQQQDVELVEGNWAVPLAPFLARVLLEDVDVLHLHWTHPYFLFGSKERLYDVPFSMVFCALAATVFLFQVWIASKILDGVVWTVHNKCNHERRYESLDKWVSMNLVEFVDAVQVWDDSTEQEMEQYLGDIPAPVHQIPHGNYIDVYDPVPKDKARKALELPKEGRVYLFFGMIRPYKDIVGLIEAFREIDHGTLVVAGNPKESSQEAAIRRAAEDADDIRIVLEYVPDNQVSTYFGAADCVVLPYRHIFNSGSALLAMSMGRAVVAPAAGSIPTVLPNGNVLYDELEEGLEAAAEMSNWKLREVGERNHQVSIDQFNWVDISEQVIWMYESTTNS